MLTLAVESSAVSASVALMKDNKIISSRFVNAGLTHSETLLPMIDEVLKEGNAVVKDINTFAITNGPGSFTGVRIGIATVKGLAFPYNTKCVGISTLEAIAGNFLDENVVVCAVMDARRMQFYNAIFEVKNGTVNRLTDDRAISIENLEKELSSFQNVVIAGDGAELCFNSLKNKSNCKMADEDKVFQNAKSVAILSVNKKAIDSKELMPVYLRLSQAERELKLKKEK